MKSTCTFFIGLVCIAGFLNPGNARSQGGAPVLPRNISQNWYARAVADIQEREYYMRALDQPGMYGAVNHARHIGYLFSDRGYGISNFNEDGALKGIWRSQFLLDGIGRKGQWHQASLVRSGTIGNHLLQFEYGGYTVTYENGKQGMEQRFIVKKRPAGKKPLEIVMSLDGDLEARTGPDNELLLCSAGHPQDVKLVYDQLSVWDKHNKRLPAHMVLTGHRLVLTVDDSRAVYPVTVDPFAHAPSLTFTVQNILNSGVVDGTVHTLFGYSVSGAGDVSGDGIGDVIIGAPCFARISSISGGTLTLNTGVAVVGAAFIYHGISGSVPSIVPSEFFQPSGLAAGALFGFSVTSVGNAGGSTTRKGVAIGAPGDQINETFGGGPITIAIGRVYVYTSSGNFSGNVNAATTPDLILSLLASDFSSGASPPNHSPLFGFSVSDAGDVNGDGFDDLIVGAPTYDDVSAFGRINIYNGSATGIVATPATTIIGSITGGYMGFSVSTAGDVNGDGLADIIVGAPGGITAGGVIQGNAYIFHGKSSGITAVSSNDATGTAGTNLQARGPVTTGTLFGFSVSTAGDVNNDGHSDVIVGEPLSLNGGGAGGKAYVFYGSGSVSGVGAPALPASTLISPRSAAGANNLFGFSVGTAGNVVGDASSDVLVGEPGSTPASTNVHILLSGAGLSSNATTTSGQGYVFAGVATTGIGVGAVPLQTVSDPATPNLLGASVHGAGDIDGDGNADFLVGEPGGILDLGFNLEDLNGDPGSTLQGTLTTASNAGLIPISGIGNAILTFGAPVSLPVTILNFTGQEEGNGVLLNWSTAQEENSNYFGIERSTDGQNFTAIGQVGTAHNSTQITNYSFTDVSPVAGNNYYRLKMVDLDSVFTYSKVVVVNIAGGSQASVSTYPNPAHGSFSLLFRNMAPGRYGVSLLNTIGQTLLTTDVQVANPGGDNQTINLIPGLAPGTYLIRVVDRQLHVSISRIVIQ